VPFVNIEQIDGWNPLEVRATQSLFMTFGRVRPGVTPAQAASDLNFAIERSSTSSAWSRTENTRTWLKIRSPPSSCHSSRCR